MGMPLKFKLSEELADGEHWTVAKTKEEMISAIHEWCNGIDGYAPGEGFSVELIDMTDDEIEALSPI